MIKNKLSNTGVCNRWTGRSLSQCMVCNPEAHEVCRLVITSGGHRVVCRTLSGSERSRAFWVSMGVKMSCRMIVTRSGVSSWPTVALKKKMS